MPFILKEYKATAGKKIQQFLISDLNFSVSVAQKLISKGRVFDNTDKRMQISEKIKTDTIKIALFEGITKGLKPLFTHKEFAIFDKPSGIMVHPISRYTQYSLLDEIRYHFGEEANLAHRIDLETSGLVLISRNNYSDIVLKQMFQDKLYTKKYLAVVKGKISSNITIDTPIKDDKNSKIGVKMCTAPDGKESLTYICPIKFDPINNHTLVEAQPLTGRQHQIRVHLNSIGHTIVGDPIYGIDEDIADKYLCKTLSQEDRVNYTGSTRLMLQANYLEFRYNKNYYKIYSKIKFNIDMI